MSRLPLPVAGRAGGLGLLGSASRYAATHGRCPVVVERQEPGSHLADPERAVNHSGHQLYRGMATRLEDMLAGWREKYPAVETGTEITHAHPGHLLAQASGHADLVVLGRQPSHTGGSGADSVIHAVLHHARGPVAVIAA